MDFFSFLTGEKFPENYYVTFVEFAAKDAVEKTALTDTAAKVNYTEKTTKVRWANMHVEVFRDFLQHFTCVCNTLNKGLSSGSLIWRGELFNITDTFLTVFTIRHAYEHYSFGSFK